MRGIPEEADPTNLSPRPTSTERPAKLLADLLQSGLGVTVDPGHLHGFVCANFGRLSKLAHAIHGDYRV